MSNLYCNYFICCVSCTVVVLSCFVMCWYVYMWVCVCMGFVMCGYFDNCVGDLVIYVPVFTAFLYFSFMYIYSYLLLV